MARNLFGPMGVFSTPADAKAQPQTGQQMAQGAEPDVQSLARRYRIPPNILMAYKERGEDPEAAAKKILADLDGGKSFQDIVPKSIRVRASDIADEIEGIQPEGGLGKALGVGVDSLQQAFGSAMEGTGRSLGIDSLQRYGARVAEDNAAEAASGARGLTRLGDVDGVGSGAAFVGETLAQQAPQLATSIGPVAAGAAIGSVVPGIGTALGAGIGLGVAGLGNLAQFYGFNRERQKEANPGQDVNELAAFGTAIPQAATDLASDVLIATPLGLGPKALQTGSLAMRAAKGAAAGAVVEAPTEALQQAMERAQAGLPVADAAAGSEYLESAVAGGLVGGALGGVRGALSKPAPEDAPPPPAAEAPPSPLALPAPTNGGTIFLPNLNPGGDGSVAGQGAVPGLVPPGGLGAAPDEPMGPLARAAAAAPDLTPQPEVQPLFPDMKPGAKLVLADPETGELIDATFQREEGGIPIVRINGVEKPLPPAMFDAAATAGSKAVEAAKGKPGGLAAVATPKAPKPRAPDPDLSALSLDEAISRLNAANERIRLMVRPSKKVLETRDKLIEVIKQKQEAPDAQIQPDSLAQADGGTGIAPSGAIQGGVTAGGAADQVAPVEADPVPAPSLPGGGKSVAGAVGGAEPVNALTPNPVDGGNRADSATKTADAGAVQDAKAAWEGMSKDQRKEAIKPLIRAPEGTTQDTIETALDGIAARPWAEVETRKGEPGFKEFSDALVAAAKARAPVAPITTPPSERMQPDLLGGRAVSEDEMAAKERRRKEWGRFLGIAEGAKSNDDMSLEGREILIRPGFTIVRAKNGQKSDLDYRLDTAGMSRDDIAAAMRGALHELDRVAPLPATPAAPATPPAAPAPEQIAAAAAQANPNPTDAQKEAGNYQKGHVKWAGLDIAIETAKGAERRGKNAAGEEWSVKMPADYGYIKRTTGADGDQVDVYLGPKTDSQMVFVVDQVDPDTGRFDEHKVIMGAENQLEAAKLYAAGFSDGKGEKRMGAMTPMTIDQFKNALRNSDWKMPASLARLDSGKGPVYASGYADRFKGNLREAPSYLKNGKAKRLWEEGWTEANKHPMAPELPGSKGTPGVLEVKKLRTGETATVDTRPSMPKTGPKPIGTNARGRPLFEDENGVRSYSDNGVTATEAVSLMPTRDRGYVTSVNKESRGRDFLTQEEWDAKNQPAPPASVTGGPAGPRVVINQIGRDGLTDAERAAGKAPLNDPEPSKADAIKQEAEKVGDYLTQQIEREKVKARDARAKGDNGKAGIHDANIRRLRQNLWKAEEALKSSLDKGEFTPFAAHEADFPIAAAALRSAIGRVQPMAGDTAGSAAQDGAALEAVGMVKGKATTEDAWFRKQAEAGGVATYKARRTASGWKLTRDFQPGNNTTMPPTRQIGTVGTTADAIAQLRENGMRTGVPEEAAPAPAPKAEAAPKPATGILSVLSEDKQKRADELKAKLAAKVRNQTSSGVDPEYLSLGGELVALYVEAGIKKFGQMLRDFAESTGLSMREAQAPMRVAYNHVRDTMDLDGEDISEFDTADQVMAEIRAAIEAEKEAGESPVSLPTGKDDSVPDGRGITGSSTNEPEGSASTSEVVEGGKPRPDREGGGARKPAGDATSRSVEGATAGFGRGDEGVGGADSAGARSGRPDRGDRDPVSQRGDEPGRGDGNRVEGLGDAGPRRKRPAGAGRRNYRITDPEALFAGGPKARFAKNRAAMEAYQRVKDENREPTPEELDAMASFIGWGSFGQELFQGSWDYPRPKDDWKEQSSWLRDHLGKDAWISAQNSIINAHYTDPPTVMAMWKAVQSMGFKGGRILEPSMGVGNFFGLMPVDIAQNSDLTGIELEETTGGIAKMLYPEANIRIMGYEKSRVPDGFYDLVIGNWPFANIKVADRRYDRLNPSLHDYFFVKALDQVRAGGLVVGITSAFTMDGQKNIGIRQHLARNAELVAAFRLPSGAFEKYAGTKVVTDIIILRKRENPILDVSGEVWVQSSPWGDGSFNVNDYYQRDASRILGKLEKGHGTTYGKAGMIVQRPDNIGDLLENIANRVPKDAYKPIRRGSEPRFTANTTTDRMFSVTVNEKGEVFHVVGDQMAPIEDVAKIKGANAQETTRRMNQLRTLVALRKSADAVMEADRAGAKDAESKRAELKRLYQAFVKEHGKIADSFGLKTMIKLRDPNAGFVAALETRTGDPSPLMDGPTIRAPRKLDKPSIRDAFVMARNESVTLDIDRIADLAKRTPDEVIADLIAAKAIYRTPGGGYEASDVYLAGNVRQKLRDARDALENGEDMQASIDALVEVQPPDIPYFQIEARFGADWVGVDVNRQFIIETLQIQNPSSDDIVLVRGVTGWRVELSDRIARMPGLSDITGAPAPGRRGTGLSLRRFLEATLNTQTLTVTYESDDGTTYKDTKATERSNQKAADLRQKFGGWLWQDPERRAEMEVAYNEVMNAVALPIADGSFLEFPGMALKRGDSAFGLRQHQANAIWKGILNQRGIYGHEVGTGKTITMTGIAVESRRYGLARKPLLIAHNANSAAVASEAQDTYPGAKILYVNNLAPDELPAQMARMATEDWDLIVIPHSLLDRMALSAETLNALAAEDIAAYEREAIEAAEAEGITLTIDDLDDADALKKKRLPITAKEMVKARQRLLENIEKQAQRASREGAIVFEKLGIDMILVDESHEFKKPPLATRMQVKGLNTGTSNKSLALRFLTSYVKSLRGGTGVHVFTGTPITNTLSEIYHQMYYVMDDVMRQNRVDTWDGFFKTFADTIADVELTSTGDFENVERLAAFINVSELRRMAGQFLDIVFATEMPEFKPRETPSGKNLRDETLTPEERDYLENGRTDKPVGRPYKKVIHDIGPMGRDQKRILHEVRAYAQDFKNADGKVRMEIMRRGGPDAPIVYNNVPNRASMDARLHEIDAEDHPASKANRAVRNIARIYNDEPMATQVLFMDEGYSDETVSVKTNLDGSKTRTKKQKFNLANDIVEKLVERGVKREEIAVVAGGVTAEQKKAIADAMNNRKIRVVIGQTKTLGVGVNMQAYLRAMHHLDAPWMPGDLEQRNGRGERQGNTWNTVLEYRYLTEGLDGRRWQVLAIKDRFIKSFLKAKEGQRVIEGDAVDDAETMDGASLAETLSEAAGDPRLMQVTKLNKSIQRLRERERIHASGIAEAVRRAQDITRRIEAAKESLPPLRDDARHVEAIREAGTFTATVDGMTYDNRTEAAEAIKSFMEAQIMRLNKGESRVLPVEVQGFTVRIERGKWSLRAGPEDTNIYVVRRSEVSAGQPSLASIEQNIRRIPERLKEREASVADMEVQIKRLDRSKAEPFQQAADLEKKIAQKAEIERDLEMNPVPPPSWLRQGAPMDTLIYVGGEERVVTGHRWTETGWFVVTEQGDVPYMDAKSETGVALYQERAFEAPRVEEGSKLRDGSKKNDEDYASDLEMRAPVVTLSGDELGPWEDIRQLGRKAEAWYRANLVGTTVTMDSTGWQIQFGRVGSKKLGGRKGDVLLRLVPALRDIIKSADLVSSERGAKAGTERQTFHKLSAPVSLGGVEYPVVVTIREDANGKFHYDLSMDNTVSSGAADRVTEARSGQPDDNGAGARVLRGRNPANPTVGLRSPASALEGGPESLNLDFAPASRNGDAAISDTDLREMARSLAKMPEVAAIGGAVPVRVVGRLVSHATGQDILGRFNPRTGIEVAAGASARNAMRHEIIHALRSEQLWGKPFGLFGAKEWRELARAARAESGIVDAVKRNYADKSEETQTEEMVAELYRLWAAQRDRYGAVGKAMLKIEGFLTALANLLRGRGFVSAARTMEQIASGKRGGPRGPQGPGGGRGRAREAEMRAYHGSGNTFDKFRLDRLGTGAGAQAFGWGLYFADAKDVADWYRSHAATKTLTLKNGTGSDAESDALGLIAFNFNMAMDEDSPSEIPVEVLTAWADEAEADGNVEVAEALRSIDPADLSFSAGRLYEVEIPDTAEMLDFDARLSDHPKPVRDKIDALRKKIAAMPAPTEQVKRSRDAVAEGDDLGAEFYRRLSRFFKDAAYADGRAMTRDMQQSDDGWTDANLASHAEIEARYTNSDRAASEALRDAGIPGHSFVDRRPSAATRGSRNYVVYDEAAAEIVGMEMRAPLGAVREKFEPLVGFRNWRSPSEWVSNFLTDRMVSENASILALVPGRPLFAELGKSLLSAKAYLRTKEEMDALRNDWHAKSADVADEWTRMQAKDPRANDAMMDLMHRSTMTGVDPTKADDWGIGDNLLRSAKIEVSRLGDSAPAWAQQKVSDERNRRKTYATVKQMYDALPPEYQTFYKKVKGTYEKLANEWDVALEDNLKNAARIALKNAEKAHRQTMRQIKDDGLQGAERDEAIAKADEDLRIAKARAENAAQGKIKSLRKVFEGQRLKGPYFPLARFGKFFVTVRDASGKVVSFSRMETEAKQRAHIKDMEEKHPTGKVTFGTIDAKTSMRDQVDPKFVAEVEAIVADSGADADVLDAIWQRYLEALPDDSIRTSKIHRKGREGFSRDALRAFSHHMFHGAHQLARLKYGMSLQEHVDDARDEARRSSNPNRMGALVDEMQRRMEWTMNPQGAAWVAAASSLSFVWYLGVSPAAALVNLSQTTIIGPALMKARFQSAPTRKILAELGRAARDFGRGQGNVWTDTWSAENADSLSDAEKAAMREGYRRGTIDKTQAYDLASVAESGVEYNPFREKWMRRIGWAFHHTERVNREVTYLANYRLARDAGLSHDDAIDAASDMTWKIHFSYQNSDRARVMQRDWPKFFLQFRQYSVNALYRLFRDAHQSLNGATDAERREARTQLIGVSLSMMAHAGIKGVWGYGLLMALLAMFFPGDKDEIEDWMQDALLMEGDGPGVAAWNFAMGAAMNGVPGQITGTSLTERIGMPNLWFRDPSRDLEGTDLLQHYVNETLGPTVGIMFSVARGVQYATDGEAVRGFEAMTPKFVRDVVKAGRYAVDGVETMNGDDILESVSPWEILMQANGFTPARVAERFDMNNRLKNREARVLDERKDLHRAAGDAIAQGQPIPQDVMDKIRDFNLRYPEYPITGDTIRQSFRGRQRASDRNEFGVSLNPRLNDRLRETLPTPVYN